MQESEFLKLLREHQGIILKICALYRNSKEDREDLFQEIVLQLWKSAKTFEGRAKFSTWMYKISLSTAVAGFRKKQPNIYFTRHLPEMQDTNEQQKLLETSLFDALKKLNDADKALITLYLEDLSYREIAEIAGITENNVGVKLNRIKNKIQQHIKH